MSVSTLQAHLTHFVGLSGKNIFCFSCHEAPTAYSRVFRKQKLYCGAIWWPKVLAVVWLPHAYLVHGQEVVEDTLQLVILHSVLLENTSAHSLQESS